MMYTNGFVIQSVAAISYKGIDGCEFGTGLNWYFNDDEALSAEFEPYYDEHIALTYYDLRDAPWVAACCDRDYIERYIMESRKRGIRFRLLLVQTERAHPVMEMPELPMQFLGYDYAYANGDNYSAIYNEVPYLFPQFRLNRNGLFETEEELRAYLAERERYKAEHPPLTLEEGDFVIFKLFEILL